MRKFWDGVIYDTEASELLHQRHSGRILWRFFRYPNRQLYRARNGAYFLVTDWGDGDKWMWPCSGAELQLYCFDNDCLHLLPAELQLKAA